MLEYTFLVLNFFNSLFADNKAVAILPEDTVEHVIRQEEPIKFCAPNEIPPGCTILLESASSSVSRGKIPPTDVQLP